MNNFWIKPRYILYQAKIYSWGSELIYPITNESHNSFHWKIIQTFICVDKKV